MSIKDSKILLEAIPLQIMQTEERSNDARGVISDGVRARYADLNFEDTAKVALHVAYQSESSSNKSDETHEILGGVSCSTFGTHLHVSLFWVAASLRGKGIGAALLARAEDEAVKRGCTVSLVDTFSFQAEGFYKKQGYKVTARLPGGYDGQSEKIFLRKELKSRSNPTMAGIEISTADIVPVIINGLKEHTREFNPVFDYNYQAAILSLRLKPSESHSPLAAGLLGHSGGSFFIVESIWMRRGLEAGEAYLRLLEMAEEVANLRQCRSAIAFVFDFEQTLQTSLQSMGYRSVSDSLGWFRGRATRFLMYKSLG